MEIKIPKHPLRGSLRQRGPPFMLTDRDRAIMLYIWKWKIASTSSIHEAINRNSSAYSTYKILDRLEKNSMVECRVNLSERFHVWQLTELGFNAIQERLGELKEDGYLSENHRHDRLVQAFQLGEWATHQYPKVYFFSEQDLRRRAVENYPDWVPKSVDHRPDGYTRIVGRLKSYTMAYEVELSAKSLHKYEATLRFYQSARLVNRVLWLTDSSFTRETILRAKECIRDDSANFHVFVDLSDFVKNGWDAAVTNERSERLFTIREKFQRICGEIPGELIGKLKGQSTVTVHLASQKVIGKSRP